MGKVMPTVLPLVDRRDPYIKTSQEPLRPTVGNTVGINTPFSVRHPIEGAVCKAPPEARFGVVDPGRRGHRALGDAHHPCLPLPIEEGTA